MVDSNANTGTAAVSAAIDDPAGLTGDRYRLSFDGAQWTLRNETTGSAQTGAGPAFSVDGVTVTISGTPAAAAGIRQCDLILKVQNKPVQTPTEVQLAVDRGQVGEPMELTLQRNGEELIVEVRPRELPRNN